MEAKENMTSERIKDIHQETAYPESLSVKHALLQVWNECQQYANSQLSIKQEEINKLKEKYEQRLKTVLAELKDCPLDVEREARLETKASCYRTLIAELKITK